jgi:hypothetical protein
MDTVIEWLNENELRAYPLQEGTFSGATPENFLLDLCLKVDSSFDLTVVKLLTLTRGANSLTLNFTGAGNTFQIALTSPVASPLYIRNPNGSLAVFGDGVTYFGNTMQPGDVYTLNIPVEPSTVFQFDGAWLGVNSLVIATPYKTATPDTTALLPLQAESSLSNSTFIGEVEFTPGYNYKIDFTKDVINMRAAFGLGEQLSCLTEFVAPSLKDCTDIISYINGVPPNDKGIFKFSAGTNIALFAGNTVPSVLDDLTATPNILNINANTLFVGLTFLETDLCSPVQLLPTNN